MKSITLKITTRTYGDHMPPQAGDTDITKEEEDVILNSVERIAPELPEDSDTDTIELVTVATMDFDADGRCTIAYRESELSGMEGTITKLTFLSDDRSILSVIREGAVNSTLVLEAGKIHTGLYQTPVMPLEIATRTYRLDNTVTPAGGTIHAEYALRIGTVTATRMRMTAVVQPH